MANLPRVIVGDILSRLDAARDVVLASWTLQEWREAYREHLQALSFHSADCAVYRRLSSRKLEALITKTILETSGLRRLSILMQVDNKFTNSTFGSWLAHTRESLRELSFNVLMAAELNILEMCEMKKLEKLVLANNSITLLEYNFQIYPCLKSLSLVHVDIRSSDLRSLVAACPRIEILELFYLIIRPSDGQFFVELSSRSLKSVSLRGILCSRCILEADSIETLRLKGCSFVGILKLVGKGTLKYLEVAESRTAHLEISDTFESLEGLDIRQFQIGWAKLYQMISRSSKLKWLQLWKVNFDDRIEAVDLEMIANRFPQLAVLSLRDGLLNFGFHGSRALQNVNCLRLGWTTIRLSFLRWIQWLVEHCPCLQHLIFDGVVSNVEILASFTTTIFEFMKNYPHVKVKFVYE